jgi:glyoxylase-like metal-dependent hydrolase (beta-lactamase superfamily II)
MPSHANSASSRSTSSRRHFLESASLAATALLVPRTLFGAEDDISIPGLVENALKTAPSFKIDVQRLRGNINVLLGAGGNIAVLPGPDGKLIVDSGIFGTRPQVSQALAAVSADPITHLINSHWHFDHTGGNDWLHSEGATIIAQENARKHLSTATLVKGWAYTFPALPAGGIPAKVFTTDDSFKINGTEIQLNKYAPAHTDCDISIHFLNADILHVADTFWNGFYPFIDYSTGGSLEGTIRATEANLAKITNKMIVIPGHGPVTDKSQLIVYRDLLVTARDKVAAMKKQGRSLTEIVAAKPTATTDEKWGGGFIGPKQFIGLVYEGV